VAIIWWYLIHEEIQSKTTYLLEQKRKSRITAFIVGDETQIQIGSTQAWLWVAPEEPIHKRRCRSLHFKAQEYANCRDIFMRLSLIKLYGKHILFILMMDRHGILKHVILWD
jgi:hypothetical protein